MQNRLLIVPPLVPSFQQPILRKLVLELVRTTADRFFRVATGIVVVVVKAVFSAVSPTYRIGTDANFDAL
jgi:hypothetical protein